jgi:hypothetical protein
VRVGHDAHARAVEGGQLSEHVELCAGRVLQFFRKYFK